MDGFFYFARRWYDIANKKEMDMETTIIKTDETLREVKEHGRKSYPFEYYDDYMNFMNGHLIDWHWHDEFEWVYALEGDIECSIESETFLLKKGDALFVNSKALHRYQSEEDMKIPNILFSKDFIAKQDSELYSQYLEPILLSSCNSIVFHKEKDEKIIALLLDIFEKAKKEKRDLLDIQISVLSLWRSFFEEYVSSFAQRGQDKNRKAVSRCRIMIEYIMEYYQEQISLEDIASSCNVSESEALRCFRTSIQTTPFDYLINFRIQRAKKLLLTTDDTIRSIAAQVGMGNINYFNRVFKKRCGMTPSCYRADIRNC